MLLFNGCVNKNAAVYWLCLHMQNLLWAWSFEGTHVMTFLSYARAPNRPVSRWTHKLNAQGDQLRFPIYPNKPFIALVNFGGAMQLFEWHMLGGFGGGRITTYTWHTCALWSPAGKGLTSWFSFVVSYCEFVTFPLVSWVTCGTWLLCTLTYIERMCVPNSPFFQRRQVYDKPPFLKRKYMNGPIFWCWYLNGLNFLTPMSTHLCFVWKGILIQGQIMNKSTFCEIK